jgi:hypothetical protein
MSQSKNSPIPVRLPEYVECNANGTLQHQAAEVARKALCSFYGVPNTLPPFGNKEQNEEDLKKRYPARWAYAQQAIQELRKQPRRSQKEAYAEADLIRRESQKASKEKAGLL